jgi:probable HAF family extracellular repeat protein
MKSRILTSMVTLSLLAALAAPIRLVAQNQNTTVSRYIVRDLGTLQGGNLSEPFFINENGVEGGYASLADGSVHAVLFWQRGIFDLGTLGGPNSMTFADNQWPQAVGVAETSISDPNGEDFCGFGTHLICLPFLWQHGVMKPLPTLGGNNGGANQINNYGVAAGWAETTTSDPGCPAPQVLQFKPVVWVDGKAKELPTVADDPDGIATSANDFGQVVGGSGDCTTFSPNTLINLLSIHILLWENGRATDLGNLGGTTGQAGGNLAWGINNRGQVIGVSDLPGDTTFHAFLWTKATGIQDLGAVGSDVYSTASGINDAGDVVGLSLDANFNGRAFLWHHGVMTDLNTLAPNSPLYLLSACSINLRGDIAGLGTTSTGEFHAYLAVPDNAAGEESSSAASQSGTNPPALPESVRTQLQRQMSFGQVGARLAAVR